jgi:hypothetical protein
MSPAPKPEQPDHRGGHLLYWEAAWPQRWPRLPMFQDVCPDVGMKTDRIRTDITDIVFVFIFMSGFGFEYG